MQALSLNQVSVNSSNNELVVSIRRIKGEISSLFKLIGLGKKKYIVKLIDLEKRLTVKLQQQQIAIEKLLSVSNPLSDFVSKVMQNQITILRGDTGSGKSTNSMIQLVNAGYNIISAQPRIINTYSLHEYCSKQCKVGYRNGNASFNTNAPGMFVTTGVLVNQLLDPTFEPDFVAIDECHEFSQQQELCLALIKQRLANGWKTRVLIVSATLNDDEINSYFDGYSIGNIHMGGVKCPIVEHHLGNNKELFLSLKKHVSNGDRILIFLAGKGEIIELDHELKSYFEVEKINVRITHCHSEVDNIHDTIKDHGVSEIILSTDICAAGVTPENLQVVVDYGIKKEVSSVDGIWKISPTLCSQAELDQRKGRTGRTCDGTYYLVSDTSYSSRIKFPIPEIKRINVESLELSVRKINKSLRDLSFVHQPTEDAVNNAIELLTKWGCIDELGAITNFGIEVSKLPLDTNLAVMLVKSLELGCVSTTILATSILGVGNFFKGDISVATNPVKDCDIATLMNLYKRFINNTQDRRDYQHELITKKLFQIKDNVTKLTQLISTNNIVSKDSNPENYKQALATTMRKYRYVGGSRHGNNFRCMETGVIVTAERNSVVSSLNIDDEVVGIPRSIKPRNGGREFTVLTSISKL
jgi:HrpA-like RNA helicase